MEFSEEQQAHIDATVKTAVEAASATLTAASTASETNLKSQISNLEKIKLEGTAALTAQEEALAKASGDYTTVIERKEAEHTERYNTLLAKNQELTKSRIDADVGVAQSELVSLFADGSKDIAQMASKSMVTSTKNDDGELVIQYTKPNGDKCDSIADLVEAVKSEKSFATHIKATVAQGGGLPKSGEGSGVVDITSKKAVQADIQARFGLSS